MPASAGGMSSAREVRDSATRGWSSNAITASSLPAGREDKSAGASSFARDREAAPTLPELSRASTTTAGGRSAGRGEAPAADTAKALANAAAAQSGGSISLSDKRLFRVATDSSGERWALAGCGWQATMARPPRPDRHGGSPDARSSSGADRRPWMGPQGQHGTPFRHGPVMARTGSRTPFRNNARLVLLTT